MIIRTSGRRGRLRYRSAFTAVVGLALSVWFQASLIAAAGALQAPYSFAACGEQFEGALGATPVRSLYVPMRDGVRIALDVVLPDPLPPEGRVPAVLTMTRYWRSGESAAQIVRFFATHGYAVVNGDVRGTGASFGVWLHHRSRDETLDFSDVMDWIQKQPWSDGRVAGWGVSYTANTVDWMVERNHPSFRAAVSRFPDYDPYADEYFPGGVPNIIFSRPWSVWVKNLDLNRNIRAPSGEPARGVRPVDEDPDGRTLALAIARRRDVPDVGPGLEKIVFKDDRPDTWGGWSMDDWGIHSWSKRVESSGTPIQSWGGWMDAGTANGVLRRFMTLSNPQRVLVGPWSHAGLHHVSQYRPAAAPTDPPMEQQHLEDLCFLKGWLWGKDSVTNENKEGKFLIYYTMGEERWKTSTAWPIPGTGHHRWYFHSSNGLSHEVPAAQSGADRYKVDFDATTGTSNRWATPGTSGDVIYADRAEQDKRLLTYTSAPLEADLEITGHPVVTLYLTSTHQDGAFFVYLEDVAPDGTVYYVTEGILRAIHRKVSEETPPYRVLGPYHSYKRNDTLPLVPGELAEITFELHPTSVLVRQGHRLRVAIAGADKGTFSRLPEVGDPVLTVERNREHPSYIELPIIPRR
ncbi:MAG: CocE/NonD family hydrolase [Gemmatimonadetes bacterium]|nr:CocE/NonD family hydrolase [Gemmatimonadota bacterium]